MLLLILACLDTSWIFHLENSNFDGGDDIAKKDAEITRILYQDAKYFPIPESIKNKNTTISYVDSWQAERTYGGQRGHDGCDLMASEQKRNYYPVLSVSDGVVEKMGWLELGGYRIGIRSKSGVYYYYAHLSEYAKGMQVGKTVYAGEMLGFMGDTGYSKVEGTCGNFPVHLHFGMYLNNSKGEEICYNTYPLLQELEEKKLRYYY